MVYSNISRMEFYIKNYLKERNQPIRVQRIKTGELNNFGFAT